MRAFAGRLFFPVITVLLVVVMFFSSASAASKARPISIKSFTPPCEVRRATVQGQWLSPQKDSPLDVGDVLRTGAGGKATLLMSDGSRMTLGPNSRLEVEAIAPNRVFALATGKVKAFIKKLQGGNKFQIKTPLASASVRGTVFEVGFDEGNKKGYLDVSEGTVALNKDGKEILVPGGLRVGFSAEAPLEAPVQKASGLGGADRESLRREVSLGMSKEQVMASAAYELRLAEYQEGKVMMDVFGKRVRLEEYIIRRPREVAAADQDKAFKLVVLNDRSDSFNYYYYRGIFNTSLPTDLSVAFRQMNGKLGAQPNYWLTSYEMGMSNTVDTLKDTASGGHLVKVTFDGTNYTLIDADPASPTYNSTVRTVAGDATSVIDGVTYHTIYDAVNDRFLNLTDAQVADGNYLPGVYDAPNDSFRNLTSADTYWRTNFNTYSHALDGVVKQSYAATVNTLLVDQDPVWSIANGGSVVPVTEEPSGTDLLHERSTLYYSDGTKEIYDTYIIGNDGSIAPASAFSGISAGSAFKNELLKWNYEQVVQATEFHGRKIDLVVEPKILIESGIIK